MIGRNRPHIMYCHEKRMMCAYGRAMEGEVGSTFTDTSSVDLPMSGHVGTKNPL